MKFTYEVNKYNKPILNNWNKHPRKSFSIPTIKEVLDYYQERVNRLNDLIPDIEDYISEYEIEYGSSKE